MWGVLLWQQVTNDPFWSVSGVYLLLLIGFIAPPPAFTAAGITVERLFRNTLGSETSNFVYFHLMRTTLNRIVHGLSIAVYCVLVAYLYPPPVLREATYWTYIQTVLVIAASIGFMIGIEAYAWFTDQDAGFMSRTYHPLVKTLRYYESNWKGLGLQIETESQDESTSQLLGVDNHKVLVTENWLVTAGTYRVAVVPHRAVVMEVSPDHVGTHVTYRNGRRFEQQVVTVSVTPTDSDSPVKPFQIRIFGTDFTKLTERLQTEVNNVQAIVLEQTPDQQFENAFIKAAYTNRQLFLESGATMPHYAIDEEECVACLANPPDVKLVRRCVEVDTPGNDCRTCHCRPFWCLPCLSRWFLHRQPEHYPVERKLQGRTNCPTCRAPFCLQDVIPTHDQAAGNQTAGEGASGAE